MSILWNIVRHIHPFSHTALSFGVRHGEAVGFLTRSDSGQTSDGGVHSCASLHHGPQLPPVTEVFRTDASTIEITASAIVSIFRLIVLPCFVCPIVPFRTAVVKGLAHPIEDLHLLHIVSNTQSPLRVQSHIRHHSSLGETSFAVRGKVRHSAISRSIVDIDFYRRGKTPMPDGIPLHQHPDGHF